MTARESALEGGNSFRTVAVRRAGAAAHLGSPNDVSCFVRRLMSWWPLSASCLAPRGARREDGCSRHADIGRPNAIAEGAPVLRSLQASRG